MHKHRWSHKCVYHSLIRLGWVELTGQKSKWYTFKWYTNHQFSTSETVCAKQKKRKTGNHSPQIKWLILSSEVWISNPIFDCICCTVESVIKYVKLMWELTNWQRGVYQSYFTDSILSGMTNKKNKIKIYDISTKNRIRCTMNINSSRNIFLSTLPRLQWWKQIRRKHIIWRGRQHELFKL